MILMKACHLLLGRSWLYNMWVRYNGYKNTYSFVFNGRKVTYSLWKFMTLTHMVERIECSPFVNYKRSSWLWGHFCSSLQMQCASIGCRSTTRRSQCNSRRFFKHYTREATTHPTPHVQHPVCCGLSTGAMLPNMPIYRTSPTKHKELQWQVQELLDRGFIQESLSPYTVPMLLTPNKDGSWHICIDSRSINQIIVKYRFHIPRLDDLLDVLHGAQFFSKIVLRSEYHKIRIQAGDE